MDFLLKTRFDESKNYGRDVAVEVRSVIDGLISLQEQLVVLGHVDGIDEDMANFVMSLDFGALSVNLRQNHRGGTVLHVSV